jgi:hypothetical protein
MQAPWRLARMIMRASMMAMVFAGMAAMFEVP